MKVLAIVGTQLRHKYFLARLAESFTIEGVINFERTLVQPPKLNSNLFTENDIETEKQHLASLKSSESKFFSSKVQALHLSCPQISVANRIELNSESTINWVKSLEADVMLDFGSGIIDSELMKMLPEWRINLHGGLSPYYKGSATLFWPFYMQQPELVGTTFHLLNHKIDGGDILQHVRPAFSASDSLTDIMCKCIVESGEVAVALLRKLALNGTLSTYSQHGSGKLFLEKDYRPSCIPQVYRLVELGMLERYLSNKDTFDDQYQFIDQLNDSY